MSLGVLVDIAISILAIMILFTLVATAVNEFIADNLLNLRGRKLEEVIRSVIGSRLAQSKDSGGPEKVREIAEAFYNQPDIRKGMEASSSLAGLFRLPGRRDFGGEEGNSSDGAKLRLPSAIEPKNYARAMLALLRDRDELTEQFKKEIADYRNLAGQVAGAAGALVGKEREATDAVGEPFDEATALAERLKLRVEDQLARLEEEYAEVLARASGWYLRSTRTTLFFIGLFLAVGSNVDFLRYAERAITEGGLEERVKVAEALVSEEFENYRERQAARESATGEEQAGGGEIDVAAIGDEYARLLTSLETLDVRVGWGCVPAANGGSEAGVNEAGRFSCEAGFEPDLPGFSRIMGWVLVAFGVTLGAQFWFDLFKKVVSLRTAGATVADAVKGETPKTGV